ncbi:MAG: MFS transporter [Thermomicrobiales bacterium]
MAEGTWYERNRVLIWICALITVNQLGFGSIVPVVPLYAQSYGVSQSAIGLTIGIYGLARFLINVPAGKLADRLGRRATLALGGLAAALGNFLCAVAPTYLPFLGARFIAGAGAALTLTAAQIVLADISTPARRGRIMAIYSGVFAFAVGIGPYPGGVLAERFNLAAPVYAFTVLGLAAAARGWFRVPETKGWRGGVAGAAISAPPPALSFGQQLRLLLSRRGFALISIVSFSTFFARTGALFNVIPVLGRDRLDLGPDQIGLGLGLISVVGLALAYPSGVLVDRFGRKAVIVPATLLTGASLVLFSLAPSYLWFIGACAVWSLAAGIASDAPGAYAADSAPPGMNAAAMSTYRMLADAGYVVGPLLLGAIADAAGANTALAFTAVLLVTTSTLFGLLAPETYRSHGGRPKPASDAPAPALTAPEKSAD